MAIIQRSGPLHSPSLLLSRLQTLIFDLQRWQHTSAGDRERYPLLEAASNPRWKEGSVDFTWKTVDSKAVGIRRWDISSPSWKVMKILKQKGFQAYLVGGCVRDLLLKRTPKDFDVITTASLEQVKKYFRRCRIVGRLFPICLVSVLGSVIEVSSFDTTHKNVQGREAIFSPQMPNNFDEKHILRWKNCIERDFTINGLFYDPFADTIYDYVNGIRDLRALQVRTVIPPYLSFKEDCARILRGLRIAARLGLRFSRETAAAIKDLSSSIVTLDMTRLKMELNLMLAYGAAESSICLLQKFKLIEILLPSHAAYLADQARKQSSASSIMLMKLFSNVDRFLAADRPSNCSLWLGVLAFHLALLRHPQDALVVWIFSSILYHGSLTKAVMFARESCKVNVRFSPEVVVPSRDKSDELLLEETSQFALLVKSSVDILASTEALGCLLARCPDSSQSSDLVFVSEKMANRVRSLFDIPETDTEPYVKMGEMRGINYSLLKVGNRGETRFVLAKVIMETMSCKTELTREDNHNVAVEQRTHLDRPHKEVIVTRNHGELNDGQNQTVTSPPERVGELKNGQNQEAGSITPMSVPEKLYHVEPSLPDEPNQNISEQNHRNVVPNRQFSERNLVAEPLGKRPNKLSALFK